MSDTVTDFLLAVEGLSVSFDGFKAVDNLSFYVDPNEIRVIIGPNGAGKTTVLDLICGRTKATDGSIKFRGAELTTMKEHQIVRAGVGRKFQNPSIYEDLTVLENLEISFPRGRSVFGALSFRRDAEVRDRIEEVAAMIFLSDHLDQQAEYLSHGQKQWLEIGMLLIQDPALLMLDEPVAGMSVSEREEDGRIAAPDHREPLGAGDRARHGVRGRHRPQGDGAASRPGHLRRGRWRTCRPIPGSSKSILVIEGGCHVGPQPQGFASPTARARFCTGWISRWRQGEIVAVLGRNGMGKSTLMKSLIGLIPTKSGEIRLKDAVLTGLKSHKRVEKGIAYVPQGRMIFGRHDGAGKYRDRAKVRAQQVGGAGAAVRAVPGAKGDAAAPWRQSFGRPAAATRHRPRTRHRPERAVAG